jgi:hypothetical protein
MRKCMILPCLVVLMGILDNVVDAAVVKINWASFNPTTEWSFDYDLQELTVVETIYDISHQVSAYLDGSADSKSTFTIVRTITNETGITWTGYVLEHMPGIVMGGVFVEGSASSTKLLTITEPVPWQIEFSGSPPVLDGESFTIQFDFAVLRGGGFLNDIGGRPVPEPATIVLLGLGAAAFLRLRRPA